MGCQTRAAHTGLPTARVSASRLDTKNLMKPDHIPKPHHLSNKALYNVLQRLRGPRLHDDQAQRIEMIVRFLLEERGEKPNIFLYEALVVANWDCHYGSVEALERIWSEMIEANIPPSRGFLHAALKVRQPSSDAAPWFPAANISHKATGQPPQLRPAP